MRKAAVYHNKVLAGELIEVAHDHYIFRYDDAYFYNPKLPAISLTLPKTQQEYVSNRIFPYFSNMVAEGTNLAIQGHYLKMDANDTFQLLVATAANDTIGAVTLQQRITHEP